MKNLITIASIIAAMAAFVWFFAEPERDSIFRIGSPKPVWDDLPNLPYESAPEKVRTSWVFQMRPHCNKQGEDTYSQRVATLEDCELVSIIAIKHIRYIKSGERIYCIEEPYDWSDPANIEDLWNDMEMLTGKKALRIDLPRE